jgi:hypothetical protein
LSRSSGDKPLTVNGAAMRNRVNFRDVARAAVLQPFMEFERAAHP